MRARAGAATGHDPDRIAAALLDAYRRWKSGPFDFAPDWDVIRHFTRRNLTGLLAGELDRLTANR